MRLELWHFSMLTSLPDSYALVYGQWGFGTIEIGLSFIP